MRRSMMAVALAGLSGCSSAVTVIEGSPPAKTEAGSPQLVAVGANGVILRSEDCRHWLAAPPPSSEAWLGIAWGGGRFVAVGEQGGVASSSDGASWSYARAGAAPLTSVAYGGDHFVIVGGDAASGAVSYRTSDGASFTSLAAPSGYALRRVAMSNDGKAAAIGERIADLGGTRLFHLAEGGWQPATIAGPEGDYAAIVYAFDRFIVLDHAVQLRSGDGEHWGASPGQWFRAVDLLRDGFGGLLGVEGPTIIGSVDGWSWSGEKIAEPAELYGIATLDYRYAAVGRDGAIFCSTNAWSGAFERVDSGTGAHLFDVARSF